MHLCSSSGCSLRLPWERIFWLAALLIFFACGHSINGAADFASGLLLIHHVQDDMDLREFDLDIGAGPAPVPAPSRRRHESSLALSQWSSRYLGRVKLLWIVGRSPPHVFLDDLDKNQMNTRVQYWLCDHPFVENFPDVTESRQYCFGVLLVRYSSHMPVQESQYALPFEKRIQSGWDNNNGLCC